MENKKIEWHFCYWDEPISNKEQINNTELTINKKSKNNGTKNYTSRQENIN